MSNKKTEQHFSSKKNPKSERYYHLRDQFPDKALSKSIDSNIPFSFANVQPKLRISQPGDIYEQEAERISQQVMNMSNPSQTARALSIIEDGKIMASRSEGSSSDMKKEELSADEKKLQISRNASIHGRNEYSSKRSSDDNTSVQRGGFPLDPSTEEFMESRFGFDFGNVKIHVGENAARSARSIDALAYTVGNDIVFGEGQYRPNTSEGKKLLSHELTHVIQQTHHPHNTLMRQPLYSKIPSEIAPTSASLSFTIPGNSQLTDKWNDASTKGETKIIISISPLGTHLTFTPPIHLDIQYPFSNVDWSGLYYDFTSHHLESYFEETDPNTGSKFLAKEAINKWFQSIINGTRMNSPGYHPMTDPDIMATLTALWSNFKANQSKSKVNPAEIKNIGTSVNIRFNKEIKESTAEGGISIKPGGSANISIGVSGSFAEGMDLSKRKMRYMYISSEDITLQIKGEDFAKLNEVYVSPGGRVTVYKYSPLKSLETAKGYESIGKELLIRHILGQVGRSDAMALMGLQQNLPEYIHGTVKGTMNEALTNAFIRLVREYHDLFQDFDLPSFFGISPQPED